MPNNSDAFGLVRPLRFRAGLCDEPELVHFILSMSYLRVPLHTQKD